MAEAGVCAGVCAGVAMGVGGLEFPGDDIPPGLGGPMSLSPKPPSDICPGLRMDPGGAGLLIEPGGTEGLLIERCEPGGGTGSRSLWEPGVSTGGSWKLFETSISGSGTATGSSNRPPPPPKNLTQKY